MPSSNDTRPSKKSSPNQNVEIFIENYEENLENSTALQESPKRLINQIKEDVLRVLISKIGEANSLSIKCMKISFKNLRFF